MNNRYIMEREWGCIVVTCSSASSVAATEREIMYLQRENRIPSGVTVLTVEDPAENIGSGAATLNALVIATEFLSVQQKYMVITADVLSNAHILILLHGRNYLYSSCGKAFVSMPAECFSGGLKFPNSGDFVTNLEVLFHILKEISHDSPPGVWVCSTDMLLFPQKEDLKCSTWKAEDAVMFCVTAEVEYATNHGVVGIDKQGLVEDIIYCGSAENIEKFKRDDNHVSLVSGIVYLSVQVAESLLSLQALSPLDSCTYMGLDMGADPIQVSLFFDILIAMASKISKEDFLCGRCGKVYNKKVGFCKDRLKIMYRARSLIWEELSRYKIVAKIIEDCQHIYWSDQLPVVNHAENLHTVLSFSSKACDLKDKESEDFDIVLINSILSSTKPSSVISTGTVICHSHVEVEECLIGKNCFISGIHYTVSNMVLIIPDNLALLEFHVSDVETYAIRVVLGMKDNPTLSVRHPDSTLFNRPWSEFFEKVSIKEDQLWDSNIDGMKRTLMNAKLYPSEISIDYMLLLVQNNVSQDLINRWISCRRYSLAAIIQNVDHVKEFDLRRNIYAEISSRKIKHILRNNLDYPLFTYLHAACVEKWHEILMETLDSILLTENNPVILTRTLSCIAGLLGTMSGGIGGLKSGPGSNRSWATAFDLLQNGTVKQGMLKLKEKRVKWIVRPDRLMRAARHYERAAQILIQNSVKTAQKFINLYSEPLPEMNKWIFTECPARIDLQGGWTDTPPICYEMGGSVVNISVLVDGEKPIGAKACRINEPIIKIQVGAGEMSTTMLVTELPDLMDYDQPNAQGALLKAAILYVGIVNPQSNLTLMEQLQMKYNGGFEIHSWSNLPQGCGLGGSSILAGAVISVLWSVSGKAYDKQAVLHAVLFVEQMLTTGGGWQDQVGGIMGGINRGYSDASLPLCVQIQPILVPLTFVETLNKHLVLIYTGKVRLAKNLLQNVIRNWYARNVVIIDCFKELISSSLEMEKALLEGNLEKIGQLMNKYWEIKKVLAPGCEPSSVKEMMLKLKPICHGQLLTGAGGGGFMCILTKEPDAIETVNSLIHGGKGIHKTSLHKATIHFDGLKVIRC